MGITTEDDDNDDNDDNDMVMMEQVPGGGLSKPRERVGSVAAKISAGYVLLAKPMQF